MGVQIILQWSTGKSTLYTSLKKKQGIYFEGRLSFLGFKYESEVTAFLEQQGEAKERETELTSPFVTNSPVPNLPF